MKIRILPALVTGVMVTTALLSSCLKSDYADFDYPAESSIKSFSIGTLHQTIYGKSSKGEDSIYTDTVSYAHIPFTIDQINRRIYNKDSLPKDVDITRVVTSITADNAGIYYVKDNKDTLWTSTDSIDFTNEVTFKVWAYSELQNQYIPGKPYTVKINVHKLNPDSLVWAHFGDKKFAEGVTFTEEKAVYLNEHIYVFGNTEAKETKVFKANVVKGSISAWENVPFDQQGMNIYSATAFNNDIYYVAGGKLYTLDGGNEVGNLSGLTNLICVSNGKLLAYKGEGNLVIEINSDGTVSDIEGTPFEIGYNLSGRLSAYSAPSSHNESLWRTVVMTNNESTAENDTTANVFSYLTYDEKWVKFQPNNPTTCPNQANISMISYDGKLFAYGEEFDYFYSSTDNGLNWKKEDGYMIFPSENKNGIDKLTTYRDGGCYSSVVESNANESAFIWFIWKDGSLTRVHLNRLLPKN